MYRKLLKAKIHRAVVTGTEPDYEGSITIDRDLLERAGILEHEFVLVANISNGARFETYTLAADPGSGIIELNGAAARLAQRGDLLIIMAHAYVEDPVPETWSPEIILVTEQNQVREALC